MGKPIDMIIARFGGVTKLAKSLALPITTVHAWKRRGRIPADRFGDILEAARASGIALTADEMIRGVVAPEVAA